MVAVDEVWDVVPVRGARRTTLVRADDQVIGDLSYRGLRQHARFKWPDGQTWHLRTEDFLGLRRVWFDAHDERRVMIRVGFARMILDDERSGRLTVRQRGWLGRRCELERPDGTHVATMRVRGVFRLGGTWQWHERVTEDDALAWCLATLDGLRTRNTRSVVAAGGA